MSPYPNFTQTVVLLYSVLLMVLAFTLGATPMTKHELGAASHKLGLTGMIATSALTIIVGLLGLHPWITVVIAGIGVLVGAIDFWLNAKNTGNWTTSVFMVGWLIHFATFMMIGVAVLVMALAGR